MVVPVDVVVTIGTGDSTGSNPFVADTCLGGGGGFNPLLNGQLNVGTVGRRGVESSVDALVMTLLMVLLLRPIFGGGGGLTDGAAGLLAGRGLDLLDVDQDEVDDCF